MFPVRDYIRVRCDIRVRGRIRVGRCILIQCPQYNTWYSDNFKRWFLLTGSSTLPSYSQVSKIPTSESRKRKLTSQRTTASESVQFLSRLHSPLHNLHSPYPSPQE